MSLKFQTFLWLIGMFFRKRLIAEDMHKLASFLNDNPDIINLDLCYNNFGDEGIKILSQNFLSKENNIRHLNLIGCSLGGEGMESLYLAAETLNLLSLRVNGNNLGNQVGVYLLYQVLLIIYFA